MTVIGVVRDRRFGAIHQRHVIVEDLAGPASDLTIAAGGTGDIVLSIAGESPRDILYAGIESVSGLPTDAKIQSISFDKSAKKLTLTVYNAGGADITISANSVTVRVVSVS